jgi:hypothetical protein
MIEYKCKGDEKMFEVIGVNYGAFYASVCIKKETGVRFILPLHFNKKTGKTFFLFEGKEYEFKEE